MKKVSYLILILNVFLLSNVVLCNTGIGATSITANMTVDDNFDLYISTDDSQLGTYLGSGTGTYEPAGWQQAYTFTFDLTPGVVNYIHVMGWDMYGTKAAFLGDFSLSDSTFAFTNGTQSLVTDSTNWSISNVGFGQSYYTPDAIGLNGVAPWGSIQGISSNAYWIWSNQGDDLTTRYFSTAINPIPVPGAIILGGIGAGFVGWLRRRRTI